MTKNQLKQYKILKLEAVQLEQELLEHLDSSMTGSAVLTGMPKGTQMPDIVPEFVHRSEKMYDRLMKKKDEALRLCKEIEGCIEELGPLERALMRARYVECKEWEQICIDINYSLRQTHRLHTNILMKMARHDT